MSGSNAVRGMAWSQHLGGKSFSFERQALTIETKQGFSK